MIWRTISTAIALLGCLAMPLVAQAQQTKIPHVIVLYYSAARSAQAPFNAAFERGLEELGFAKDRNITIAYVVTDGTPPGISQTVKKTIALKPDVIVVWGALAAQTIKNANPPIPVVFLGASFPVETGVVPNLRRPGGMITGIAGEASVETYGKRLQLFKEVVPGLNRVALLYDANDPNTEPAKQAVHGAAVNLGIDVQSVGVRDPTELDQAFETIKRRDVQGVLVVGGTFTWMHRQKLADLALRHHLPSLHHVRDGVTAGALLSYGPDLVDISYKGAAYVVKILKGAKPGELPVEQPTLFKLSVNEKTAKALGIKIPESIMLRADEVIR